MALLPPDWFSDRPTPRTGDMRAMVDDLERHGALQPTRAEELCARFLRDMLTDIILPQMFTQVFKEIRDVRFHSGGTVKGPGPYPSFEPSPSFSSRGRTPPLQRHADNPGLPIRRDIRVVVAAGRGPLDPGGAG